MRLQRLSSIVFEFQRVNWRKSPILTYPPAIWKCFEVDELQEHSRSSEFCCWIGRTRRPMVYVTTECAALMQRMDSSVASATSCAMSILGLLDKSNHSATGTLHQHRSTTFFLYVALSDSPPKKFAPSRSGLHTPPDKIILQPTRPTTPNGIIGVHSELLLLLVMHDKLAQTYRISMWTSMHAQHTTPSMLNFLTD